MSKEYDTIHVYARPGIRAQLQKLASRHKRSLSSEIQYLIEQAYEEEFEHGKTARHPAGSRRRLV